MRLLLFDDYKLGVWTGEQVLDASAAVADLGYHSPQEMMRMIIEDWATLESRIQDAADAASGVALTDVTCCAPLPRPGQLVCLAGNYLEPQKPERGAFNAFLKSPNSVIGHEGTVTLPATDATFFHFEPELALVIGKRASHLSEEEALDHVFGYTQFMDVSARGLPGGFFLGKSWHTFGPMGPLLVTRDEIANANNLDVRLWVEDDLRHDISTKDMDRHIPELLVEVTKVLTLEPGDVVSTGTHHFGLKPVQDGEVIRLEIDQMGPALAVKCADPSGRTWS
ncbi:fumarylacetoacetate hydrolase domain-containing protein 2-like [Penaeus monodon]|uniref:fumarylacetoacetate hydrolase domain-containing protein 2-like n=1 Tax=Penaeus monodon TaxID=6687 RepID=UPI0018A76BC8|nr:fumarylacetoacetate hydrolase domain-containing protein 2-like [Penaeus monodon]